MATLGPDRDKELGINQKKMGARMEHNRGLDSEIARIATYLAEGHGMAYGYEIANGMHMGYIMSDAIRFAIAVLMENKYLSTKQLKKAIEAAKKEDEEDGEGTTIEQEDSDPKAEHPGQYL